MKLLAIYRCDTTLVFIVEYKEPRGLLISTMEMFSLPLNSTKNDIFTAFQETILLAGNEEFSLPKSSSEFNNKLIKLCNCRTYKDFVNASSLVKLVLLDKKCLLIPMQKSKTYVGFEGFNGGQSNELSFDGAIGFEVLDKILELLAEIQDSY